ncbi:TetR/AcrR family transcriptional regulator [Rhizobium lusitanum]|uniref:AcrR family transcriptional regulator n=1 Tax=Rhizobium lusitanum TaxID=293958 RepID=A0A7X0ITI8_9HYPH|nr:TetR/AcrR family transcriptional regulator C-terminal domain-containing protein [Rhizobium lusitanum]MBB6486889.1 AcrR family transcriptional regulator [Rhizobium lusitanum]
MEKRARGRPAQDRAALRAHLVGVATEVLLDGGFARFSIDAVAKAGGFAKKTIYSLVSNREELVGEIVASWTESYSAQQLQGEPRVTAIPSLLTRIHRVALSRDAVSLFRMIVSDPEARAQLGHVYGENGIEQGVRSLVVCLQAECKLEPAKLETVARAMLAWLIGEPLRRAALGLEQPYKFSDKEVDRRVKECLELFAPIMAELAREI